MLFKNLPTGELRALVSTLDDEQSTDASEVHRLYLSLGEDRTKYEAACKKSSASYWKWVDAAQILEASL